MTDIKRLHPAPLMVYFMTVILLPMFVMDPVILALSLLGSALCLAVTGRKGKSGIALYVFIFAAITLINPLLSHNGATELFFINDRAVTLEALIYGAVSAIMIISVIIWFRSFSAIMTGEKLLYVAGSIAPKSSLILCTALRFIPLFKKQSRHIRAAQTTLGLYSADNVTDKLRGTARVFSALTTWSLENAIDTADSMKARGYGLKHRKPYSVYRYRVSDAVFTVVSVLLAVCAVTFAAVGGISVQFYPRIVLPTRDAAVIICYASYGALALLPALLEIKETLKWKYLMSKI